VIFEFVFPTPAHLEPKMEMTQVEFFLSGLVCLITGWSIFWAKPEATQFKTLDVIHLRYTRTDTRMDGDDRSNTQIHS
jgi:hypothetical protein